MWPLNANGTPRMIDIDRMPRFCSCFVHAPLDRWNEPRRGDPVYVKSYFELEWERKMEREKELEKDREWMRKMESKKEESEFELFQKKCESVRVTFVTPVSSFESGWDYIHRHSHPELHDGVKYGATYWQRLIETNRREKLGRFEIDLDP